MSFVAAAFICPAHAMTVEEAYRSIPHRRTVFDATQAKMTAAEATYLERLFGWMDGAIVARQSVYKGADVEKAYQPVWKSEQDLRAPDKLKSVQSLFVQAARDEQDYLREWRKTGRFDLNAPLVASAGRRLIQGYNELMKLYPSEDRHNQDAFYDYPCALDFK